MSKLTTKGNLAIFEYPPVDDPEFTLSDKGELFIYGYNMVFVDQEIGVAKRFELGLDSYVVVGNYEQAVKKIRGLEIEDILQQSDIDLNNSVFLIKQ